MHENYQPIVEDGRRIPFSGHDSLKSRGKDKAR
jgi:hypothetical protein